MHQWKIKFLKYCMQLRCMLSHIYFQELQLLNIPAPVIHCPVIIGKYRKTIHQCALHQSLKGKYKYKYTRPNTYMHIRKTALMFCTLVHPHACSIRNVLLHRLQVRAPAWPPATALRSNNLSQISCLVYLWLHSCASQTHTCCLTCFVTLVAGPAWPLAT